MDPEKEEPLELSAGQLWEELEGTPLAEAESRVLVPKKGAKLFESDGSMKVVVIRPCVSRGKRLRGLPPIYTPRMLERNAAVFTDWPMYEDHLVEQLQEDMRETLVEANLGDLLDKLEERARRIRELGGRVVESWWDSSVTFKDDRERGYQKGGVVAKVIPQDNVARMLERDPGILNVSINAWPTGAKEGVAPWDASTRGMVVEGLRRQPRGSVDWVFRGGAGGRPYVLAEQLGGEDRELAVSVLEALYDAEHHGRGPLSEDEMLKDDLKNLKPDQLRAKLTEEGLEHLIPALAEKSDPAPAPAPTGGSGGITAEQLKEALDAQARTLTEGFEQKLEEREDGLDDRVQEELDARDEARTLSRHAHTLIEEAGSNGLPSRWVTRLKERYAVIGGVPETLRLQEETVTEDGKEKQLSKKDVLEKRVKEDLAEAVELIREANPRSPLVEGLGGGADPNGTEGGTPAPRQSAFRDTLREAEIIDPSKKDGDKAVSEDDQVYQLVKEAL